MASWGFSCGVFWRIANSRPGAGKPTILGTAIIDFSRPQTKNYSTIGPKMILSWGTVCCQMSEVTQHLVKNHVRRPPGGRATSAAPLLRVAHRHSTETEITRPMKRAPIEGIDSASGETM